MDVIEKLIAGHREVREREDFARKLFAAIDNEAFFWDNALQVEGFFAKEIKEHFEIEEQVLFPLLHKILPQDKLAALDGIEKEHAPIMARFAEFEQIVKQHTRFPSKSTREYFVKVCGEMLELVSAHAHREDRELFSLLRSVFGSAHYKELEEAYFAYIEKK